jgi:hypothetical protein
MLEATVYYVELTETMRTILNRDGWSSFIGKAYLRAQDGDIDETNEFLLVKAGSGKFENAEAVFVGFQNLTTPWSENPEISVSTTFPRSMMVGDVIEWSTGHRQRCIAIGFTDPVK